jgi:hypothetical protein
LKKFIGSIKKELYFIELVQNGTLKVYKDGRIKNKQTGNFIGAKNKNGYIQIGFKKEGKTKHILVHRLVYIVFKYKMRPLPFIVNHRDGIKDNNYYKNLERSNYSHNTQHAWDSELIKLSEGGRFKLSDSKKGEKSLTAKITNEQAFKIRKLYKTGNYSHRELGLRFNLHHSTVGSILRQETFKL